MHFLRFSIDDEALLERQLQQSASALSSALAADDVGARLRAAAELGSLLITARREQEARKVLSEALAAAEDAGPEARGWLLLHLGTAEQYLDQRTRARALFDEALRLAAAHELIALESYVQHHMGRCLVEDGEIDQARSAFQRALHLRETLGDPRQASSQRALDLLEDPRWARPASAPGPQSTTGTV